jgi:nickel-dependent lactate racemase
VRFYIATGTHAPMCPDEFPAILPAQILERYPVVSHDCDDTENLVHLGFTSRGVPVWVNRDFYASDLKIVVGNIEPHHFAGFSGGYKTAAIGMAGRETINANHIMLADPRSRMGMFEQNPLRQDIEEIGKVMQVQFALNARLNARKDILAAYFGDPGLVLQAGIPDTRRLTETQLPEAYDLVITSPGGYPKDINFYQSQKALTAAAMVVRDGGTIILVAACAEGGGSASFEEFMEDVYSYEAVLEKFQRQGFRVGPHKALQVALVGQRVRLMIVSEMPHALSKRFLLTPAVDLQSAYEAARMHLPENARVAVLPHATNILPVVAA